MAACPGGARAEPDGHLSPLESRFLGPAVQVTEGLTKAGEGYFSPDGRRIAYQAVPRGYPFYQIYVQDFRPDRPGPMPPRLVSTGRGRTTCAWFSPDGRQLLFASSHLDPDIDRTEATARAQAEEDARTGRRRRYQWDFDPRMDLFVADLDAPPAAGDTAFEQLTTAAGYDAECSFSPDGTTVLFVSDRAGAPDLYLMDRDGGNLRRLTATTAYDGGPFFSPDGRWIAYRTDRVEKDRLQIHVMRSDGSGDVAVTAGEAVHWAPFWHPTKPWLIWTGADHSDPTRRPNYDLWIVRYEIAADGPGTGEPTPAGSVRATRPLRLTDHPSADVLPSFSPDGTLLLWTSGRGGDAAGREPSSQLWVSRLDLAALEEALAALPVQELPLIGFPFEPPAAAGEPASPGTARPVRNDDAR
jgi:TolB protein